MLLIINEESVGQRIDNFLFSLLKGVPKTRIYRMIRKGEVRVDSKRITANFKLEEGQKIRIPPVRTSEKKSYQKSSDENLDQIASLTKKIEIIDERNGLLIINKPEGIAVHGGSGNSMGVIETLRSTRENPNLQLVHRLDKETSGLLLVSSKRLALLNLHRQIREGKIKKTYIACSHGRAKVETKFIVEKPLMRFQNKKGERMVKIDKNGLYAITKIKCLESYNHQKFGWVSLLQCEPITGRTHQIRVHLQSLNLPIIGDKKYGFFDEYVKYTSRMFLHAWKLKFSELGSDLKQEYSAKFSTSFFQTFLDFKFFKLNK